jgi:hypothetical protein
MLVDYYANQKVDDLVVENKIMIGNATREPGQAARAIIGLCNTLRDAFGSEDAHANEDDADKVNFVFENLFHVAKRFDARVQKVVLK